MAKLIIYSGKELIESEVPDLSFYWGELFRAKTRLAVIGKAKAGKSFLAMELAVHIATGTPFLGMETKPAEVLFLNFEISKEKFQQRFQDLCKKLGVDFPERFRVVSLEDTLYLDTKDGYLDLHDLMSQLKDAVPDVVVIDPRRNSMSGDENQSEIVNAWCTNVYKLMQEFGFATVIVHHSGKNTTGSGRGSSVFDGWVESTIWIDDQKSVNTPDRRIRIQSRDSDLSEIAARFEYPLWKPTQAEAINNRNKVVEATKFIRGKLEAAGVVGRSELREKALAAGHSEYAFKTALAHMKDEGLVSIGTDQGRPGNWQLVTWSPP